jgi:uncharacterized membrane protein YqjE
LSRPGPAVDDRQSGESPHPGLLAALRRLAGTGVELLITRGELLAAEIEEERTRLMRLAVLAVIAGFFLAVGLVTLTIFVILLAWNTHPLLAAGILTALYLGIGLAAAVGVRRLAEAKSKLFSASLAELRKDHDQLVS